MTTPSRLTTTSAQQPAARRQVHLVDLTSAPGTTFSPTLGYLQGAAETDAEVAARCSFTRHVLPYRGDTFEQASATVLGALDNPLIVAFTIYFWNRVKSLELARRVKQAWPECRIVVGGNDVTYQQDALFSEAPWVDVLVHGEGELRFVELLRALLDDGRGLSSVNGISYWAGGSADRRIVSTAPAGRIMDLGTIPSPLDVFSDAELASTTLLVYETNRGCPYGCAFCYWGTGAINSKVRQFPMERIEADLDRIIRLAGPHQFLTFGDANFGILPRDVEITRMLVDACGRHDKKVDFVVNWAKSSSRRLVEMARILHDAGLITPVTLSAQSFSPTVLDLANRTNIRANHYRRLQAEFRELDIRTYTELIWGMPGETYDSLLDGFEEVVSSGGSPIMYPLVLLNNTEYTREAFRAEQKIEVQRRPVDVSDPEMVADLVVAHAHMTQEDWLRGIEFRQCVYLYQKFLLRCTLRVLHATTGARVVDLCDRLRGLLFADPQDGPALDPVARRIAENFRQSWIEPARIDLTLLGDELGVELDERDVYGRQEIHLEALLHRLVRDPERLADALDRTVAHLLADLPEESRPDPEKLRAARDLDLAACAVTRSQITGTAETSTFRAPAEVLQLLRDAGDLSPRAVFPSSGRVTGRVTIPEELLAGFQPQYTFSRYVGLGYRGALIPLRDAAVECDAPANSPTLPAPSGQTITRAPLPA